ncbi:MAG: metal ABC transporter permease [Pirellulales bacterium]|nr:metal ABC transporter permease [Pirellulales bacterium]
MDLLFWAPVMCAGIVTGASTGLLGGYIVGMRIPFLGICVAHAALAGAVFGALAGLTGPVLLIPALAAASISAVAIGLIDPQTVRMDINVILGILFSLMMGMAFLGLGLFSIYGVSDNEVRNLLWGSLAFCRWRDVWIMVASAAVELIFVAAFYKEMRAILFSRTHAAAAGVRVTLVWTLFLLLASLVLTVNFETVGGLMIYSLLANPAVAASRLVRGYGRTLLVSAALGAASGFGGLLISAATDLPTGAVIVILSSLIVVLAAAWKKTTASLRAKSCRQA